MDGWNKDKWSANDLASNYTVKQNIGGVEAHYIQLYIHTTLYQAIHMHTRHCIEL